MKDGDLPEPGYPAGPWNVLGSEVDSDVAHVPTFSEKESATGRLSQ